MKKIFLYPGQLACSDTPAEITTMLGSCIAVALYDAQRRFGGLNHFLLPEPLSQEAPSPRYGIHAIPKLIEGLLALGSAKKDLVAKVYGGASILRNISMGQRIGARNVEFALSMLEREKIRVIEKNVEGEQGRRICLQTDTGLVQHYLPGERDSEAFDVTGFEDLKTPEKVKVLIVDDSATVRNIFWKIFEKQGLQVVGAAANAYQAREMMAKQKPDVITLDIEMPQMNGVKFLEKVMQHMPTPVVMVSSLGSTGEAALRAMELGAIEFVEKPHQFDPEMLRNLGEVLVQKVRAAASMPLVARRPIVKSFVSANESASSSSWKGLAKTELVLISGNTGAAASLEAMLSAWTSDSPPVVIAVSSITAFLDHYLQKLKTKTDLDLRIAQEKRTALCSGTIYFVPEGKHGKIEKNSSGIYSLLLEEGFPRNGQIPSGDFLLETGASSAGESCIGILLSGFGRDGVGGLSALHSKGGFTLAEYPGEAAFPYVPQTAVADGVVDEVLSPQKMFQSILKHRNRRAA